MINYALIIAGGRGRRLMPLTKEIPKAMIQLKNKALISYSLVQLKKNIPNIIITVGYKGASLAKYAIENKVSAIFNTIGKGNAWWLFNTLIKHINEPILVLTCDNIVNLDLKFIFYNYKSLNFPPCMIIPVTPVKGIDGDYIFGKNGIVYRLDREESTEMYCSGIQVVNPFLINEIIEVCDDFYEVWKNLIKQKRLCYSEIFPNDWYAVNTKEQLGLAPKYIIKNQF